MPERPSTTRSAAGCRIEEDVRVGPRMVAARSRCGRLHRVDPFGRHLHRCRTPSWPGLSTLTACRWASTRLWCRNGCAAVDTAERVPCREAVFPGCAGFLSAWRVAGRRPVAGGTPTHPGRRSSRASPSRSTHWRQTHRGLVTAGGVLPRAVRCGSAPGPDRCKADVPALAVDLMAAMRSHGESTPHSPDPASVPSHGE